MQQALFSGRICPDNSFKSQLLKWIGNKQKFACEIISNFPDDFNTYYEPFLGSAAVLATLSPKKAIASDVFKPLIDIWKTVHDNPPLIKKWYSDRYKRFVSGDKKIEYKKIKSSYNTNPNAADLLFLSRTCYGGVVRFRKHDGHMSTPCGIHNPISPESFANRVDEWHLRTSGTSFQLLDYREAMELAEARDLIYCDPPYSHSQTILYGAQNFDLEELFYAIARCKDRGVYVALSIDGKKHSGKKTCELSIPKGLFKREIFVNCGASMLKRFQMSGKNLKEHEVADRLLLTF